MTKKSLFRIAYRGRTYGLAVRFPYSCCNCHSSKPMDKMPIHLWRIVILANLNMASSFSASQLSECRYFFDVYVQTYILSACLLNEIFMQDHENLPIRRTMQLGCELCPRISITPAFSNGSDYIFDTSMQPTLNLLNSSSGTGCTLVCWTVADLTIASVVPDTGPPQYPIECDDDVPCGADESQCVNLAAVGGSFAVKTFTTSVRIRCAPCTTSAAANSCKPRCEHRQARALRGLPAPTAVCRNVAPRAAGVRATPGQHARDIPPRPAPAARRGLPGTPAFPP